MAIERIWGSYNTFENPEYFENLSELDIWCMIDKLREDIFWTRYDINTKGEDNSKLHQLINAQYNLEYLMCLTKRFGVKFDKEPSKTEHVEGSESFNSWYEFWANHFYSMSDEVYQSFVLDKSRGKDISRFLPNGSWKDLPGNSSPSL